MHECLCACTCPMSHSDEFTWYSQSADRKLDIAQPGMFAHCNVVLFTVHTDKPVNIARSALSHGKGIIMFLAIASTFHLHGCLPHGVRVGLHDHGFLPTSKPIVGSDDSDILAEACVLALHL
jgi:hypothetical protein